MKRHNYTQYFITRQGMGHRSSHYLHGILGFNMERSPVYDITSTLHPYKLDVLVNRRLQRELRIFKSQCISFKNKNYVSSSRVYIPRHKRK